MNYSPLDLVESYCRRFIAYPSDHARVAHVLWIAHTHLLDCFDTTPRLAFMSAEKESGKTRALEISELFVRDPLLSFNATTAVIIRLVAQSRRTVLYDEIDGVFGNFKAQEANAELCGFLNSGYGRGAKAYRCTTNGKKIEAESFDAFAPVAVAGLRNLPDTLASRAIFVRMKRRAPDEELEPFRLRYHPAEAKPIKEELEQWCEEIAGDLLAAEPKLPARIVDRAADIWEPLIAIADVAGSDWPARARAAASHFVRSGAEETMTPGVELLAHIKEAFGDKKAIAGKLLIDRLLERDESPWKNIRGRPLDDRGLAKRLKQYGIKPKTVRIDAGRTARGYTAADFADAWRRYLGASSPLSDTSDTSDTNLNNKNNFMSDVLDVSAAETRASPKANGNAELCPRCDGAGCDWCEPEPGSIEPDLEIPAFLDRRPQ